jgi:hypothetical protein
VWDTEELFGVKRWRNDSPFMQEYIRADNQMLLFIFLFVILSYPFTVNYVRKTQEVARDMLTSDMGRFDENDLI